MIAIDIFPAPRPLVVLTALSAAVLAMTLIWALVDPRLLAEAPVWAKPAKFALSFVVLFGTLALVERRLSPAWRDGRLLRITVAIMAAAMMVELGYMILQAAQQQASHFNFSTPFTIIMYQVMGVGAFSLILGVAIFGTAALRDRQADFGPALRWGVGWGFIMSFALTLITAGYMSSTGTHVGSPAVGAATIPVMGWSASVGDIRPAHFLALHAMQVLPLAGLWMDRRGIAPGNMRWVALVYVVLVAAVFVQALMGMPLIRM